MENEDEENVQHVIVMQEYTTYDISKDFQLKTHDEADAAEHAALVINGDAETLVKQYTDSEQSQDKVQVFASWVELENDTPELAQIENGEPDNPNEPLPEHLTKELPFQCEFCEATFAHKNKLKRHLPLHTGERKFACEFCGVAFRKSYNLTLHKRIHTGEKPFHCDQCDASYSQSSNLTKHKLTHLEHKGSQPKSPSRAKASKERPFKYDCGLCEKRFRLLGNFRSHLYTHTGEKPFQCDICKAGFKQQSNLKMHRRTHTGEKPFACDQCDARFNQSSNLKKHLKVHTEENSGNQPSNSHSKHAGTLQRVKSAIREEKPYKCHVCGMAFKLSGTLTAHVRLHTGEKPFKCDLCDSTFRQASNLTVHRRVHTGEKPYPCDQCNARFRQSSALKNHRVIHEKGGPLRKRHHSPTPNRVDTTNRPRETRSERKPIKCSSCDSEFATSANLKVHMRTHTGEKPYKCDVCDSSFNQASNLKLHKRTHTGEKPFSCDQCGARFSQSSNLTKHRKIHVGGKAQRQKPRGSRTKHNNTKHTEALNRQRRSCSTKEKTSKCRFCVTSTDNVKGSSKACGEGKHFHCDICKEVFSSSSELACHKLTHTEGRSSNHEICIQKFTIKSLPKKRLHESNSHTGGEPVPAEQSSIPTELVEVFTVKPTE